MASPAAASSALPAPSTTAGKRRWAAGSSSMLAANTAVASAYTALTVERDAWSSSCSGCTSTLHAWNVPRAAISRAAAHRAPRARSTTTRPDDGTFRHHAAMRLLVLGSGGMLGRAVAADARRLGHDVVALTHADLDVTDAGHVTRVVTAAEPRAVVNC